VSRPEDGDGPLRDITSSRFLRPFNRHLARFDGIRLRRIGNAMETAARSGGTFHLWWHPENFGADLSENMAILTKVLDDFQRLRDEHGMQSRAMCEIASHAPPNRRHSSTSGPDPRDMTWARKRAVDVHDETASYFSDEYSSDNVHDSPFRYGRSLVDALWSETVAKQPPGALCPDIGCGIGTYMTRLIEAGFQPRGIEPSLEMRKPGRGAGAG